MKTVIRLDWATCNFDPGTVNPDRISELLCGSAQGAAWRKWRVVDGSSSDVPCDSPLGLRYRPNNGWAARPHRLDVSGVGCDHFAETLPIMCDMVGRERMGFSRLDFAFDVLIDKESWKAYIADVFQKSLFSDRQRKRYRIAGEGEAMTIYIGARTGAKFFRIYNKTLENPLYRFNECDDPVPDDKYVIRYEVELKKHHYTGKLHNEWFDPSLLFYMYYSGDEAQKTAFVEGIRKMWQSFAGEVLLPAEWGKMEFELLPSKRQILFKTESQDYDFEKAVSRVVENIGDYPHSFDKTLSWITSQLGKFIPWIMSDEKLIKSCIYSCKDTYGFLPDTSVVYDVLPRFAFTDDPDDLEEFDVFRDASIIENLSGDRPVEIQACFWDEEIDEEEVL